MNTCFREDQLQSFADNELGAAEKESIAGHITNCVACRKKFETLRSSALKMDSLLDSLVPDGMPMLSPGSFAEPPQRTSAGINGWAGVAATVAIAAIILLAVILTRRAPVVPKSPEIAIITPLPAVLATSVRPPANIKRVPVRSHAPISQPKILQFHALDNGGLIEEGLIYRINLPVLDSGAPMQLKPAKTVPAEVIVDETGQVRAIRFLQ